MMIGLQQRNWRFIHDGGTPLSHLHSYAIRQKLKSEMPETPILDLAVRTSRLSTLFSPITPTANEWMSANEGRLMSVVAGIAGQVIPVNPEFADLDINEDKHWLYTIPELVVEKKQGDWSKWRIEELADEQRTRITHVIREGLAHGLAAWGLEFDHAILDKIRLISDGKPMILVNSDGPRPMARLRVQFIAPFRLDGNVFVGGFPMMGHGKVIRGGQVNA